MPAGAGGVNFSHKSSCPYNTAKKGGVIE
jgi:hypothetical protein